MNELMLSVAVLKVLKEHIEERYNLARADAEKALGPGDRHIVRSPLVPEGAKLGPKLGAVYMTDPKNEARITDEGALSEWLCSHKYRPMTKPAYVITATEEELISLLMKHAPRLLKPVRSVTSDARKELLSTAKAMGEPVGPGGELDIPGISVQPTGNAYVACKADEDALLSVYELITSGRVALDGTVRPELEEAQADV